jgi:hypothetical protein
VIALVCIEAVAIVLLSVLVAGLLRSHAEILRALHGLGVDVDWTSRAGTTPSGGVSTDVVLGPTPSAPRLGAVDASGHDIVGTDPSGGAVRIAGGGARHDTLVAFLSTGCSTCRTFWDTFRTAAFGALPGDARLVVVTRGPEAESPGLVRDIAPPTVPVVLSSDTWDAYDVPVAPYFVMVEGTTGRIVGEGAGTSWAQVTSLLSQALRDGPQPRAARRTPSTDRAREARADEELLSAGIGPGDPRLYPTHLDAERGQTPSA